MTRFTAWPSLLGWEFAFGEGDRLLLHRICGVAVLVDLGEVLLQKGWDAAEAFVLRDVLQFVRD